MSAFLAFTAAILSAAPPEDPSSSVYHPSPEFASVIRGQTPGYDEIPSPDSYPDGTTSPPGYGTSPPPASILPNPFQSAPPVQDPFLGQPSTRAPFPSGQPELFAFGTNGPQPYRFGWTLRQDAGYLPMEETEGDLGELAISEFDTEVEYTTPSAPLLPAGWIFSFTQQYNLRLWDGPLSKTPTAIGLPGNVHRIGWDLEVSTPANQPWSAQLAVNPSLNTDFERSPSSDAWNWDARGIAFYRANPYWMIALGAGFWDRVDDRVIPYAGVVWTPDDRWEWRLLFPKSRVSYFLGNPLGIPTWVYASGEYHVESYEIEVERVLGGAGRRDTIEIEDWRALLGLRGDNGLMTSFVEAGWVFGRDVEFRSTPGFDISSGLIVRGGVRY